VFESPPMIVCSGEALIDMIPTENAEGETVLKPTCGGAIFNTAIALGRLNTPVSLFSGLSTDLFGSQLRDELRASQVDTSRIIFADKRR